MTHKTSLGDSNHCVITFQCLQLCKQNLHQVFIYLLAITEWVYTFLIPKISPFFGSFSRVGSNRVVGGWEGWWEGGKGGGRVGVVGGLNIGV